MLHRATQKALQGQIEIHRSIGGFNWNGPCSLPRLVFQASKTIASEVTHAAIRKDPV
jgi:hypothetical protein